MGRVKESKISGLAVRGQKCDSYRKKSEGWIVRRISAIRAFEVHKILVKEEYIPRTESNFNCRRNEVTPVARGRSVWLELHYRDAKETRTV